MSKYPRSPHFSFSPGATRDDRILSDISSLLGRPLVCTEKLDGSNVCLTRDAVFARSHSGPPKHASFDPLKAIHGAVRHNIDPGLQVFGEWCAAVHSIEYSALPSWFFVFGVRDETANMWWDWESVCLMSVELGVPTVPVLWHDVFMTPETLQASVMAVVKRSSCFGPVREGAVVRWTDSFSEIQNDSNCGVVRTGSEMMFSSLAKWVRANHVQTSEHWTTELIRWQPLQ